MAKVQSLNSQSPFSHWSFFAGRDVFTGATGATMFAPKFLDNLTLFKPGRGGGRFCPPLGKLHQKFSCGYVPGRYLDLKNGT